MQKILVAGVLNQPFGSWPVASESDDGVIWSSPSIPFANNDYCTGLATDGVIVAIANQLGYLAITTDMVNYTHNVINDGFGITSFTQAVDGAGFNHWLAVGSYNYINGYGPYPPQTEVAQIYKASSASSLWEMVWSHPDNNSEFYQIKYFQNAPISVGQNANVWVAVGFNGTNNGDIWYSLDYGTSWTPAPVPDGAGIIYSTAIYTFGTTPAWYWGCDGKIFISYNLTSSDWQEVELNTGDTATEIAVNPVGAMVINGVNTIYITFDGLKFITFSQPGYVFNGVQGFIYGSGYRWLIFARSTLTQFTMWYSDDLVTWSAINNGIEVQGFSVNS